MQSDRLSRAVNARSSRCYVLLLQYAASALVALVLGLPAQAGSPDTSASERMFKQRCTACHTYGKGIKVGPDLKGVTERRSRAWLVKFISSSSTMIRLGDPTAKKLFNEYKQERMPDWSDLSPEQIGTLLDYFAADGPEKKEPSERLASTATPAEIEMGRRLFNANTPLTHGGPACVTCHVASPAERVRGGTLGPNLATTYLRYRDKALSDFFKRPCFLRDAEVPAGEYLTPEESFALKAYLAKVSGIHIRQAD
jgi:mono/diheme cytochrome c family protein